MNVKELVDVLLKIHKTTIGDTEVVFSDSIPLAGIYHDEVDGIVYLFDGDHKPDLATI